MSIFDAIVKRLTSAAKDAEKNVEKKLSIRTTKVIFPKLPETYEEFVALPQAKMETPAETAALTVVAFNVYPRDPELSLKMVNYLRGPRPISEMDRQFIAERMQDKDYVTRSYFKGATYKNDYEPSLPYTVSPFTNPHSDLQNNMKRMWINSGGADSPRCVDVRLAKDGKWYLWEQNILADIRKPDSTNPWAE
ncbi:MAG: hypothetical protein IJM85_07110 [Clostridia bacterium]|nr:hypothetical protein [Clostridia bacterium]